MHPPAAGAHPPTAAQAAHNSIWSFLVGVPWDRAIRYHKVFSVYSAVLGAAHGLSGYYEPAGHGHEHGHGHGHGGGDGVDAGACAFPAWPPCRPFPGSGVYMSGFIMEVAMLGLLVTGTGVVSATHVQAISGTTVVLSKPTSKTIRGVTLTFTSGPANQYPTALTLNAATNVALGQIVTGTGIPTTGVPTTITAIAGTTITLSRATATTVSSGTLTFVSSGYMCLASGDVTKLTCTIAAAGYYNGGSTGIVSACGTQTPGCGSDTAGTCVLASYGDSSKLQCTTASTSYHVNTNGVVGLCGTQTGCKVHTATGTAYTQTGSATQGSTTVTLVSAANVVLGMSVIGSGVEDGSYVAAISGTTLTLSIKVS